jgi:nucleoside-diphosphate-sugar epimerase
MIKTAIVTGSAGFIGGHLTEGLLREGYKVVGIDNMRSGLQSTMDLHISYDNFIPKYYDIRSEKIDTVFREHRPDAVFHLAAISGVVPSIKEPVISDDINVNGTVNILNIAQKYKCKRVVFSSSSSVYGGSDILPTPESVPLNPRSPYALQKKIGEEYCKMFSDVYGLDTVCLRYFNVFGPRQRADSAYAAVVSAFCDNLKNNTAPTIYGDGEQTRDFCFVENVVSANILAANYNKKLNGESFNVGCGKKITINNLAKIIGTLPPRYEDKRQGDVDKSQADITKIKNILDYNIKTSFEEGVKNTVRWHLKENK